MPDRNEEIKKPTCFVIMPFSDPEGYPPGHFKNIYKYTFKPAIEAAGYTALRIDENTVSNLIHGKMINELVTAPMVLCDLSTNNPNVLYELGIRHAFDKPVVLVQETGQDRIFDIAGITSVEYHPTRLFEETIEDQAQITEAIIQTAEAKSNYSIMSMVALQSAQPIDKSNVSLEQQNAFLLQQMMQQITNLEKQMKASQEAQHVQHYRAIFDESLKRVADQDDPKQYVVILDPDGKARQVTGDSGKSNTMDWKTMLVEEYSARMGKKYPSTTKKKSFVEEIPVASDDAK